MLVLSLGAVGVLSQCPEFDESRVPRCDAKSDHALCVLAAHKDSER